VSSIEKFIRHNYTWDYNRRQLQGLTSYVYGKHCYLFALYMDRGYTPVQFIVLFAGRENADRQVERMFASEFGAVPPRGDWGQCCRNCI
jgi:hypothetical protein